VVQKFKEGKSTDSRAPLGNFPFLTKDGRLKIAEAAHQNFFFSQKITLNSQYIRTRL